MEDLTVASWRNREVLQNAIDSMSGMCTKAALMYEEMLTKGFEQQAKEFGRLQTHTEKSLKRLRKAYDKLIAD